MNATCDSCRAEIIWTTTVNGKRMPVDAEPNENGNLVLDESAPPRATRAAGHEPERYTSHFATCPQADQHRQRKPAKGKA